MRACEHFSQRRTCPPSAAVRQLSIADITLSCSRLTWPALASRHAGPCARKMSASWTAGRDAASGGRRGRLEGFDQMIERAYHLTQRIGRNPRVERRRVEFGMTKQNLNHTNINILLQQMGAKAVTQRVRAYTFGDLGQLRRQVTGAGELARRDRLRRIAARK